MPNRFGLRRMIARDPQEHHRVASPLELFFDLVFVVAVSFSSSQLHHIESEGHLTTAIGSYLMIFFAIWWAWVNFTWFGSSFDVDDWLYRAMTILQMAGVLVLAAGVSDAMEHSDFKIVTFGYVIMRLAMIGQWLRVASSDANAKSTALRYASGIFIVQVFWLLRLLLPESLGLASFLILVVAEMLIPVWAESAGQTPWHRHHLAERYSLFTIILLGESILASANSVNEALDLNEHVPALLMVAGSGLVIAAGMWWIYFSRGQHDLIEDMRGAFTFGYFHYVIFAAAGAFSAGIEVAVDSILYESEAHRFAALTLSLPVAAFLLGVWVLALRKSCTRNLQTIYFAGVGVVLLGAFAHPPLSMLIAAVGVVICAATTEPGRVAVAS